jgi:hypothetical protein
MAFCPNCGTPNTDQAEKCVSCAFELAPKQKAKFKGTIMMSGVQAPAAPAAPPGARPPQAAPPATAPAPAPVQAGAGGKNLGFEKTMMGPMAAPPIQPPPAHSPPGGFAPTAPAFGQPPGGFGAPNLQGGAPPAPAVPDFARAPTVEGHAPFANPTAQGGFQQPAQPAFQQPPLAQMSAPAAPAQPMGGGFGGGSTTGGFGGGGGSNTGGFGGDSMAPPKPKMSTGKILAIGCAAVLVLGCLLFGVGFFVVKDKFNAIIDGAKKEGPETLEWRNSLSQSLAQVASICQSNCAAAAVYFHPQAADALGEAKKLTNERVAKLMIPGQSEARMLNSTDDAAIAQRLGLDAAQCVRIAANTAKVVACSVPDPDPAKAPSLRIVHLSGLDSL